MENFNEDLLNACDISAFECFSVTETRDRVLKEVESLGDEELSLAYKAFFTEEKEDLPQGGKPSRTCSCGIFRAFRPQAYSDNR